MWQYLQLDTVKEDVLDPCLDVVKKATAFSSS